MRKKWPTIALAMVLSASMMFTACGGSQSGEKTGDSASAQTESKEDTSKYKNELDIAMTANPPTLDTHIVNSNIVGGIGSNIYETLFAMNGDLEPTPVLAESYEVSEDGKVYTIKLRQGVKFHNGNEMKADDVVASMNRWLQYSSKASTLIGGSTFEKIDDYTVAMTVNEPAADIMMILASSIQAPSIYPKDIAEAAGEDGTKEFIGTGPYKLEEWKQDQYVKLTRFEDYQSPSGTPSGFAGEKLAPTETIKYIVVTDDATRIAGLQTGEYDVIEEVPLERYEELANDQSMTLYTKTAGTLNLFFNTTKRTLANETLRQAVMAALNCDDIMLASYGDPNLYELAPGWCDLKDTQWNSDAGKEYYNQKNVEKAQKLMKEANYNNEPIVLVTTPDYAEMYNATLVVQEQLRQAGFNAEVESYDFSTFMEHRADPEQFDLFITSNKYNFLPIQLSVLTEQWAGLNAPEVAEGIHAIRFAESTEDAAKAWDDLQLFLYEYGAASVLGHYSGLIATSKSVENFDYFHFPVYWNVKVAE